MCANSLSRYQCCPNFAPLLRKNFLKRLTPVRVRLPHSFSKLRLFDDLLVLRSGCARQIIQCISLVYSWSLRQQPILVIEPALSVATALATFLTPEELAHVTCGTNLIRRARSAAHLLLQRLLLLLLLLCWSWWLSLSSSQKTRCPWCSGCWTHTWIGAALGIRHWVLGSPLKSDCVGDVPRVPLHCVSRQICRQSTAAAAATSPRLIAWRSRAPTNARTFHCLASPRPDFLELVRIELAVLDWSRYITTSVNINTLIVRLVRSGPRSMKLLQPRSQLGNLAPQVSRLSSLKQKCKQVFSIAPM